MIHCFINLPYARDERWKWPHLRMRELELDKCNLWKDAPGLFSHSLSYRGIKQDVCQCVSKKMGSIAILSSWVWICVDGDLHLHVRGPLELGMHRLGQKYSRLRCFLRVKGLVICFYLGWSGSILQIRNPTIFNKIRWVAGTNDSSTKCLMFQVLFFFS